MLARVVVATGSRLLLALVYVVFVGAVVTLFAVVIAWSQTSGDEIDTDHPVWVTNRGVIAGTMRRLWRNVAAGAQRASRVWLASAASIVTGLAARLERMVAVLRREVTRDAVARWVRAAAVSLSGVPPPEVKPPASAGRLARPRVAPPGPTDHAKPIHWSLPAGAERQPDG